MDASSWTAGPAGQAHAALFLEPRLPQALRDTGCSCRGKQVDLTTPIPAVGCNPQRQGDRPQEGQRTELDGRCHSAPDVAVEGLQGLPLLVSRGDEAHYG